MPRNPVPEEILLPPFNGFPAEGIAFLRRLKRNNNRPWFQEHRTEYQETVRFPMQCLVASLAVRMAGPAPEISFNPKTSIFRINRDVRFSADKAPYKTNIAASFEPKGMRDPTGSPGLYVGIEPGEIFVGGGLYLPSGEQLKKIRRSIADESEAYLAVVEEKRFRKVFGEIQGERLVKAPLGYPKDHPMIAHLRHKQFFVGKEFPSAACLTPRFLATVVRVFTDTMPLVRWLMQVTR